MLSKQVLFWFTVANKVQHDDPTLQEVLGEIATPNDSLKDKHEEKFRALNNDDEHVKRQLLNEYKPTEVDQNLTLSMLQKDHDYDVYQDKDTLSSFENKSGPLLKAHLVSEASQKSSIPTNPTFQKLQADLNKLQAKIRKFEDKRLINEVDHGESFGGLNQEPSFEFTNNDAKAMTFNNQKYQHSQVRTNRVNLC